MTTTETESVVDTETGEVTEEYVEYASTSIGNTRGYARTAHGNQTDKNKMPYVTHLDTVARNCLRIMGYFDPDVLKACYLHDTLEDTHLTALDLEMEKYSDRTIAVVHAVTKRHAEPNWEYTTRVILAGPDAMFVKLADLYHNSDPARLATLPKVTADRLIEKYHSAIYRIENALVNLGWMLPDERTITFGEALLAVDAKNGVGSGWYKRNLSTMMKGDIVKFTKDPKQTEHKILSRRLKGNGTYAFLLSGMPEGMEVTITSDTDYVAKWGSSTGFQPQWQKRLGLPLGWKLSDPAPKYLHGEKTPELAVAEAGTTEEKVAEA